MLLCKYDAVESFNYRGLQCPTTSSRDALIMLPMLHFNVVDVWRQSWSSPDVTSTRSRGAIDIWDPAFLRGGVPCRLPNCPASWRSPRISCPLTHYHKRLSHTSARIILLLQSGAATYTARLSDCLEVYIDWTAC